MKDALGQEITVGAMVLHGSGAGRGNYAGFKPERVEKLTRKSVGLKSRWKYGAPYRYVDPQNVVVIDKLLEPAFAT